MAAIVQGIPVAMAPPEGYVVDFDYPQRNGQVMAYWLFGCLNFVTFLFVAQRVYVKLVVQKSVNAEDSMFRLPCLGVHTWEIPLGNFAVFAWRLYQLPILYNFAQCGAKLALLLFYRRLALGVPWYRALVWLVVAVVVGASTALLFATVFPCRPVAASWDISVTEYRCVNREAVYEATAAMGAATDLLVLAVPVPLVVKVKLPRRLKLGLVCFFSIGLVTVFTSCMRLYELFMSFGVSDQTWGGAPVCIWIIVEANMSVICGTLPTIRPFISHTAPRLLGSSYGAGNRYGQPPEDPGARPTIGGTGAALVRLRKADADESIMYPLETIVDTDLEGGRGRHGETKAGDPDSTFESGWDGRGDAASETAIYVETRTAAVSSLPSQREDFSPRHK